MTLYVCTHIMAMNQFVFKDKYMGVANDPQDIHALLARRLYHPYHLYHEYHIFIFKTFVHLESNINNLYNLPTIDFDINTMCLLVSLFRH